MEFISDFDSGNGQVASIETSDRSVDHVFRVTVHPDAETSGHSYRTWFYFGVKNWSKCRARFIVSNLNQQQRLFRTGFKPLVRILPTWPSWQRIESDVLTKVDGDNFEISFEFDFQKRVSDEQVFFAFTYPFSYSSLLASLTEWQLLSSSNVSTIYFHNDILCKTQRGLSLNMITISSLDGILDEFEDTIPGLFPDATIQRSRKFVRSKKICFITARVHPGETCSSFVANGLISFLLTTDLRAVEARRRFVFKVIPMLNPDGVQNGNYRTDLNGVNLNRVYSNPSPITHPTITATKTVILYYHNRRSATSYAREDNSPHALVQPVNHAAPLMLQSVVQRTPPRGSVETRLPPTPMKMNAVVNGRSRVVERGLSKARRSLCAEFDALAAASGNAVPTCVGTAAGMNASSFQQSGLAFYVDLHGHVSKGGAFLYGNYLRDSNEQVETLKFARLLQINCPYFSLAESSFSVRNMHQRDSKDETASKEGCGRVVVHRETGIVHSYTLECHYGGGTRRNPLVPATGDSDGRTTPPSTAVDAFQFTPEAYAQVGRALVVSILDYYRANPLSRVANSKSPTTRDLDGWAREYVAKMHCLTARVRKPIHGAKKLKASSSQPLLGVGDKEGVEQLVTASSSPVSTSPSRELALPSVNAGVATRRASKRQRRSASFVALDR